MLLDVRVSVANTLDLLSVFVGNFDVEFLFEAHHELDQVELICTEVFDKASIFGDLSFVYT